MLNRIIDFALKNRLLILFMAVLILVYGSFVASKMEVDVFPDLTAPTVVVLTEAHGMATEEVEKQVTFQIETALNGASNVRRIRSSSSTGISIVWVDFEWNTDIFRARQIVSEKLAVVSESLPRTAGKPTLAPQTSIIGEIMLITVSSDSINAMELRTLADWQIRNRLLTIEGVSQVVVMGGDHKQYVIEADPEKMEYFDVSFNELLQATQKINENATGSFLNDFGNEYVIRGIIHTENLHELAKAVIKVQNNDPVTLNDIAEIKASASPKIGAGYLNSEEAVVLTVLKQPKTNTLVLTDRIDEALAELEETIPDHIIIRSDVFRQSDFIKTAVNNVSRALFEGGFFVAIILFLFLLSFRTTIISLIAIPLSLLVSIITLKWLGLTINTMSLGGMAIAIGVLVDDAIIDVDNVLKRLKENSLLPAEKKEGILKVIYDASVEIRASILNATLIIIVAFVPLFFLSGMEGKLLQPLGISFIVSLFASLIVAITVTPVLSSFLLTGEKQLSKHKRGSSWVRWLNNLYEKILKRALNLKGLTLTGAFSLFVFSLVLLFGFGRNFLPEFNEGMLTLSTVSMPGISLEESNKMNLLIEEELLEMDEINTIVRRTGRAELDEHAQGVFSSEVDVPFDLEDRSKEDFLAELRMRLSKIRGMNITIGQPISHRIDHMLSGSRSSIAIKVFGEDLSKLFSLSNRIKSTISGVEGLVDLNVEQQVEIPQIQIKPKREILAEYGIQMHEFAEFIDVAFAGEKVSEIYKGNMNFDLMLRYNSRYTESIESIKRILMDTHDGRKIPLVELAEIQSTSGPNTVNRENVHRKVVVTANVAGRDLRGVVREIQQLIDEQVSLPDKYFIEYGGQFESEERASGLLFYTSLLAILVIFILLYVEFRNLSISGIILVNLPLALIGGVFSIWVTTSTLSIPAIIGFITLFGIATRNGILLVSRYMALENNGIKIRQAVVEGSVDRLNPILMTALTAGLALIPLAVTGDKPGNEIQSPMAIVILGGLISSTLMNMFIIPSVYYLFKKRKS